MRSSDNKSVFFQRRAAQQQTIDLLEKNLANVKSVTSCGADAFYIR
jgi:hypothetical protein